MSLNPTTNLSFRNTRYIFGAAINMWKPLTRQICLYHKDLITYQFRCIDFASAHSGWSTEIARICSNCIGATTMGTGGGGRRVMILRDDSLSTVPTFLRYSMPCVPVQTVCQKTSESFAPGSSAESKSYSHMTKAINVWESLHSAVLVVFTIGWRPT